MHSFWASLSSRGWEGLPLPLPALASLPRAENHQLLLWARITVRDFHQASPHGPFTPPAAAVLCGPPVILLCRLMTCLALHSRADRGSDVNRCMGGWVIVLWEWRFGGTAPLGCHGSRRIVPRGDGRAFLGRREHRNGGVHTSRSWDLAKYSKAKALKCMRVVPTRGWRRSCALRLTLPWGQWKSQRSLSVRLCIRRCLHLWSKCAIYGSALLSMLRRQSTLSRRSRLPDGLFRRHWQGLSPAFLGSTEVDRGTSCHGVMHHLPLLNHHLDQRVKPLAGAPPPPHVPASPDIVQGGDKAALTLATQGCRKLLDLRRWLGQRYSFPRRRAGG